MRPVDRIPSSLRVSSEAVHADEVGRQVAPSEWPLGLSPITGFSAILHRGVCGSSRAMPIPNRGPVKRGMRMWSFIPVFVLILVGLVLLSHPAVGRFISAMMMLSILLVITFWTSLMFWLALMGGR